MVPHEGQTNSHILSPWRLKLRQYLFHFCPLLPLPLTRAFFSFIFWSLLRNTRYSPHHPIFSPYFDFSATMLTSLFFLYTLMFSFHVHSSPIFQFPPTNPGGLILQFVYSSYQTLIYPVADPRGGHWKAVALLLLLLDSLINRSKISLTFKFSQPCPVFSSPRSAPATLSSTVSKCLLVPFHHIFYPYCSNNVLDFWSYPVHSFAFPFILSNSTFPCIPFF